MCVWLHVGVKGWMQNQVSPWGTCTGMHSFLCLGDGGCACLFLDISTIMVLIGERECVFMNVYVCTQIISG